MFSITDYTPPEWAKLPNPPTKRIKLGHTPTPLERWSPSGFPEGTELWLKRDDRSGIFLSGNKVRKLEFLLADAIQQGADCVITCGGIQSNHCRATAVSARHLGLDSHILLRTKNTTDDPGFTGNLLLDRLVGANIHLITHAQYRKRAQLMEELAQHLREQGRKPYLIPEGGSNAIGSWGYIEFIRELAVQQAEQGLHFDDLVLACGSGGTAAGVGLAVKLSGLSCKVHAINVCDDAEYFYNIINKIFLESGSSYKGEDLVDIIEGYKGIAYGVSTEQELEWICKLSKETGIIFDPVYTGKAIYGLKQELHNNPKRFQGKRILFLHTGGLFGLYNKIDQLAPLLPLPDNTFTFTSES